MNTKLQAVTDMIGRSIRLFMTASHVIDSTAARALMSSLQQIEDRGYDADWFCEALMIMSSEPSQLVKLRRRKGSTIFKRDQLLKKLFLHVS